MKPMRMIPSVSLGVGVGLALTLAAGCATTECDPSQGGYLRGMGCTASGAYGQRQVEKQDVVNQERARQSGLQTDYQRTQAERAAVRQQRQAAERRYAALQSDLDGMRKKLKQSKAGNQRLEAEIDDLKRQTDLLAKDSYTPDAKKAERLQELQRQKEALERQVDLAVGR